MSLIEDYLHRQLREPTVHATLALSGVAILSESLSAIGLVLNQRQSPLVFAKVILLAMPQLIVLILPVAVLVAGLVSINRLHRDNEIVICFSSGMSRWRVISPAIRLAAAVATLSLVITLWLQPLCYRALRDTLFSVRTDLLATMIRPGQFTHPAPGVTVYAQSVDEEGTIRNLFIDRRLDSGRDTTVTAREGRLLRDGAAPMLVLRHGANQELSATGTLNYLAFDKYVLDLRPLMTEAPTVRYKLSDRYLHELLHPDLRQPWERANVGPMLAEAHSRVAAPLYNVAFMFLALAAVIGGPFSRLGYGARIAAVAAAALLARTLGFAAQAASGATPILNALQYAIPLGVTVICAGILLRPSRRTPAPRGARAAPRDAPLAVSA
ncbi:MAG TPA: LPS export ABC transporter permease LptF [Caulobacteraceae bacterium]|nr:LPS export ABC transporter permease LptF [Caulobacteraceae bacterium]